MYRMEGASTVYSYENSGGIALYAVNPPEEAITGSGTEGNQPLPTRIKWWIYYDEVNGYQGGITGEGWFQEEIHWGNFVIDGPFFGMSVEDIYAVASTDGNLDSIFKQWNAAHSAPDDGTVYEFVLYLLDNSATTACVIKGDVG